MSIHEAHTQEATVDTNPLLQSSDNSREGALSMMPPTPFGREQEQGNRPVFNVAERIAATANIAPFDISTAATTAAQEPATLPMEAAAEAEQTVAPTPLGEAQTLSTVPRSPEEDPNFQALSQQSAALKVNQTTLPTATSAASGAQAASPIAGNEQLGLAQAGQAEEMDAQEPGEFDVDGFKRAILSQIRLPRDEEEADDFENNNNLDQVRENTSNKVASERDSAAGAIEQTTARTPDPSAVTERLVTPLEAPAIGPIPLPLNAGSAMPPTRTDSEVVTPLQDNVAEVDQTMADNEITDEQLANSNEPKFTSALGSKKTAKTHADSAPTAFRSDEANTLTTAQGNANATDQEMVASIFGEREASLLGVQGHQGQTADKDSHERERISGEIAAIFEKTKVDVETILATLDKEVETKFTAGSAAAKQKFEDYVERKMDAYKEERYSGWGGVVSWVDDAFTGLPDEVNVFFVEGKKIYMDEMDGVLTKIGNLVGAKLGEAKGRIAQGRQEISNYVASLPSNLQAIGQESASEIQSQFDELEETVNDKEGELVDSIAAMYNTSLEEVDARIEEMKAANRGLIDMALGAILGVIEVIINIKNMLSNLIAGAVDVIGAIVADPIGFLGNLISGVGQGIKNFGANVMKHLTTGLIEWLTGALGPMGIQIPDDIFSLKGIFGLVSQMLGLTWDYVRNMAVKMLGENVVGAIETGVEIFTIIKNEGFAGLWEFIKDQFSDLKETVMDAIKDMVISQVIDAGLKWLLGLLTPAGAFIKAAMAIIDIVKFFVEKGEQIMALVNAVIDSLSAIASGNVGAVAAAIENAIGKAIPVIIGFLASLLGISGLSQKVQKIIKKIRKRIDKAIKKLILKAKKLGKKILGKLGIGGKEEKKKEDDDDTDVALHKKIGKKIREELQKPIESEDFADFYQQKTKKAKQLEGKHQPKLEKGINLNITFGSQKQEEKDGDLDFKVRIAPNDYDDEITVKNENTENGIRVDGDKTINEKDKISAKYKDGRFNADVTKIDQPKDSNKGNVSYEFIKKTLAEKKRSNTFPEFKKLWKQGDIKPSGDYDKMSDEDKITVYDRFFKAAKVPGKLTKTNVDERRREMRNLIAEGARQPDVTLSDKESISVILNRASAIDISDIENTGGIISSLKGNIYEIWVRKSKEVSNEKSAKFKDENGKERQPDADELGKDGEKTKRIIEMKSHKEAPPSRDEEEQFTRYVNEMESQHSDIQGIKYYFMNKETRSKWEAALKKIGKPILASKYKEKVSFHIKN